MKNKELIMVAFHKETRDNKGKLIPASLFKIYQEENEDCLGEKYIASCEQIYARKNKKMNYNKLTIEDFKGAKGLQDTFYNIEGAEEFLEIIIDDGYHVKRMTKHEENKLADQLFKHTMAYEMSKKSKVMNF